MVHTSWLGLGHLPLQYHLYLDCMSGLPWKRGFLLHRQEPRGVYYFLLKNSVHFNFVKMFFQCLCLDSL